MVRRNWQWSSFRQYATGAERRIKIESEWTPENANERLGTLCQPSNCPQPQAKAGA